MQGKFISIEGGEGVGKSTQINALASALREWGHDVIVTREPGGTEGAEVIRQLLLGGSDSRWLPRAEALLFAAARSDHVERLIHPALLAGKWVISDRYLDSSRAYQGTHSGMKDAEILLLHQIGSSGLMPDRTLVLALPSELAAARVAQRDGNESDRIGGRDIKFHNGVREAFETFASKDPERVRIIDASGSPEIVTQRLMAAINDLLP
jgi:dTMP kinase